MDTSARPRVLSGMRPTGALHLGHLTGALDNWVRLQDAYECFYCVVDYHALTTDYADPSAIRQNVIEVTLDWLAAGIDPARSCVFIQSLVPEHAELHLLLSMTTPVSWLERVPTYKDVQANLENRDLATYGFLGYPLLQTADIIIYRADLVPVGEDQASHLEISREITRRFNSLYRPVFPEPQALFTPTPRVPGIDGRKMSKSYGNAINLSDPPATIREKCLQMFTDPTRILRKDPGHPESCNLFAFHRLLSPPELALRVERECRAAEIGCVDDKRLLADQIIAFLEPLQRRRAEALSDPSALLELLRRGSARARERAQETLVMVREALGLDYDRLLKGTPH